MTIRIHPEDHIEILHQIESQWYNTAASAIVSYAANYADERFYAGAFWLCYVDYTMFGVPCFALNTESHLVNCDDEDRDSSIWSPPEWQYDVIDKAIETMSPYYRALTHSLSNKDEATWYAAIEEHWQLLARVSRRLTHDARNRSGRFSESLLPSDFVVGLLEEREGEPLFSRLVRASIAPEILTTLPSPSWEAAED